MGNRYFARACCVLLMAAGAAVAANGPMPVHFNSSRLFFVGPVERGNRLNSNSLATYPVGVDPKAVAVGDFNGDGKVDLAVADYSGTVYILLGNGAGGFGAPMGTDWIAVADLNGDGILDLEVVNFDSYSVLLGKAGGGFQPALNHQVEGSYPNSLSVADFNGDGIPDLAVFVGDSNCFSIVLGLGNGDFQLAPVAATFSAGEGGLPAVADFNGDGKPDVVFAAGEITAISNKTP